MSEDVLDEVLTFSGDHVNALASSPNILKHITGCDICNSIMLEPYILQCGHSFCGSCLESWTKERAARSTCPTCRASITTSPVLSLGLRQLALTIVHSWNSNSLQQNRVSGEMLQMKETPEFFPEGTLGTPKYDSDDDVFRCPHCSHEIEEDGRCSGCQSYFATHDMESGWATDTDYNESEGVSGRQDSGWRRWPMFSSRARGAANNEMDSNEDDDEDDDDFSSLGSFVDDNNEDNHESRNLGRDTDVEISEDDDGINDDSSDFNAGSDDDEAMQTSDDSLLEETRERERQAERQDSDIEVTGLRHRPVIIDDDDDDDDDDEE